MIEEVWFNFLDPENNTNSIYIYVTDPPQGSGRPKHCATQFTSHKTTLIVNEMRNSVFQMVNFGSKVEISTYFGLKVSYRKCFFVNILQYNTVSIKSFMVVFETYIAVEVRWLLKQRSEASHLYGPFY